MKSPRSCSLVPRWLLLALTAFAHPCFAQNVGGFIFGKIQNYQQTSSAAPVVNSSQPFQFGALITMGTATINSASMTFSGTASPRAFTAVGNGNFSILDTFATQSQLDAAYGSGNYTLSINTSAGVFSRSIFLFPFSYPTTPMLTVPANNWQSGTLVIDPAADYNFTWNAFANAQANDVIEVIVSNGSMFGPFPATQTSFTLPAGTLAPGADFNVSLAFLRVAGAAAADANIGAGYATLAKETAFMLHTIAPALALNSVVSRKAHGAAGTFDIPLPLSGTPGVECRSSGGAHSLVFTFSNPIVSGDAAVTAGTGSVVGTPTANGSTITVDLTGVAETQTITVSLTNVTDSFAQILPNTSVSLSVLVGDTNGDGTVNTGDTIQTRGRSGQPTDATNFRSDVNLDGTINSGDQIAVRSRSGTSLP